MLRFPQNGRRRKNAPAQHTLAACIESPDRCGSAASQRHSFTMPPTAYRPAQDEQPAAQRPLGCWTAAAQIPIHRQIRRADLTLPVKHIKSHLRRPLQYKSLPFLCAKNPRTAYSLPSPDASSLVRRPCQDAPARLGRGGVRRERRRPVRAGTRYRVYPSRTRSIFSPQRSASFRLFPIASLPKLQAPDACGASLPIDIEIPRMQALLCIRGDLIRIVIVRSYRYGFVPAAIGDVFSIVRLYRFRSPLFALNHAGKAALTV